MKKKNECSNLIDRQKAIDMVRIYAVNWSQLIDEIEDIPPAQSEIIRCKDCRYWQPQEEWVSEVPICTRTENGTGFLMIINGDGFCSYAERKVTENEIN